MEESPSTEIHLSPSTEIHLAFASMNNKDQNSQKKANISGENRNKNDELVIEIGKMVERPEIEPSKQCRIYRVPHSLRKWNKEAYTPQVVSIGPFHHKNERLKAMEEHKERYLRSFVKRGEINLEYLVGTIRRMEESIRRCYDGTIILNSDSFVKMILVDASFILELLYRSVSESWTSDDLLSVEPRATDVLHDLLLLENQLPFFVIEELHRLAFPPRHYDGLLEISIKYFRQYNIQPIPAHSIGKIEHFTDLLRTFLVPPREEQPKRIPEVIKHVYSATQLHEAGVKFAVEVGPSNIKFEKGVLKIPRLELMDETEAITRNIMALEQTRYIKNAYFTDYFDFMDLLINTRVDVDLLCDKEIIVNCLGDNNAATRMINNLNKGIACATVREDYFEFCKELNSFYGSFWYRSKATLKREYFSTPWRTASTVAAIILLVLTFIQTIFSIYRPDGKS